MGERAAHRGGLARVAGHPGGSPGRLSCPQSGTHRGLAIGRDKIEPIGDDRVAALTAKDRVPGAVTNEDAIVTGVPLDRVASGSSDEHVVTRAAEQAVVAGAAAQEIGAIGSDEPICPRRAGSCYALSHHDRGAHRSGGHADGQSRGSRIVGRAALVACPHVDSDLLLAGLPDVHRETDRGLHAGREEIEQAGHHGLPLHPGPRST